MRTSIATLVVALVFTGSAWAQCGGHEKKEMTAQKASAKASCAATCEKGKAVRMTAGGCGSGQGCNPADCWAANCPKLQYAVAGETLCCPRNAELLAKALETDVKYVVAGQTYSDRNEALATLAKLLNERLDEMTHVAYVVGDQTMQCGVSAAKMAKADGTDVRYRVASFVFEDKSQAEQAAQLAREAAENVKMVSVVDGKEYCCAKTAAKVASECGKKCEYKVAGQKDTTCCKMTAEVELAQAKVDAAMKAMQQSSAGS